MPNFALPDSVFEAAARRFPTPFHLYDEAGIRANARRVEPGVFLESADLGNILP